MKRKLLLAAPMMLCSFTIAHAEFYDGNFLGEKMKEYEKAEQKTPNTSYFDTGVWVGFIAGVYDANAEKIAAPGNFKLSQAMAIVANYLKAHPERWSEPAAMLVKDALVDAFGLRKN